MPVVDVYNLNKEKVGQVDLPDAIFDVTVKQHLVHEVVVSQLNSRRTGTASTKTRSEIKGTTAKPFRQKGTGRARQGSFKSPLRRGGGVIFGPKPRDFSHRPPRKVRQGAMRSALTAKLQDNELMILDAFEMDKITTKVFVQAMNGLELDNALVIVDQPNEVLEKSARNAAGYKVLRVDGLNCYDVLKYRHLILLQSSLPKIEGRLLK